MSSTAAGVHSGSPALHLGRIANPHVEGPFQGHGSAQDGALQRGLNLSFPSSTGLPEPPKGRLVLRHSIQNGKAAWPRGVAGQHQL